MYMCTYMYMCMNKYMYMCMRKYMYMQVHVHELSVTYLASTMSPTDSLDCGGFFCLLTFLPSVMSTTGNPFSVPSNKDDELKK